MSLDAFLSVVADRSWILATVTLPPLIAVLVGEHIIMTRRYSRLSSLQRLASFSPSARTDLTSIALLWAPLPGLLLLGQLLSVPGLLLFALRRVNESLEWNGFLGRLLPDAPAIQLLVWVLLADLTYYLAHRAMHTVPALWRYHQFHHSATEMNIVTGNRVSLGERGFNRLAEVALLVVLLGVEQPGIAAVAYLVRRVIELLQHSDLPWSFGLVAGPRFHRMHHSSDPADFDANYGNLLTVWDFTFGTVAHRYLTLGPSSADAVRIGLVDRSAEARENRWHRALVAGTWIEFIWQLLPRSGGVRASAANDDTK